MSVAAIVGAGQAGGRAAEALRASGWQGAIFLVGREAHPPYERPFLSKEFLTGRAGAESAAVLPPDFYRDQDINLMLGADVVCIDLAARRLELGGGGKIAFDRLLLATGASPRRLDGPGCGSERIRYLRDLDDAIAIRRDLGPGLRLLVVGGGFIGLEVAASAREVGCEVTVLEAAPTLMGRAVPAMIGNLFAGIHRDNGVDVRLDTGVRGFEEAAGGLVALCGDGSTVEADLVVAGIGILPETRLAQAAGIACRDGILVDEYGRTSVEGVFAAGDAARMALPSAPDGLRFETWQNAQDQAIAAARTLAGDAVRYEPDHYRWTDQYGIKLQLAGDTGAGEPVLRGSPEERRFLCFYIRDGRVAGLAGLGRAGDFAAARRLLGRPAATPAARVELASEDVPLRQLVKAALARA